VRGFQGVIESALPSLIHGRDLSVARSAARRSELAEQRWRASGCERYGNPPQAARSPARASQAHEHDVPTAVYRDARRNSGRQVGGRLKHLLTRTTPQRRLSSAAYAGTPKTTVYAWKRGELEELLVVAPRSARGGWRPNMSSRGGDATLLGTRASSSRRTVRWPARRRPKYEEFARHHRVLRRSLARDATRWTKIANGIKGSPRRPRRSATVYDMQQARRPVFPRSPSTTQ